MGKNCSNEDFVEDGSHGDGDVVDIHLDQRDRMSLADDDDDGDFCPSDEDASVSAAMAAVNLNGDNDGGTRKEKEFRPRFSGGAGRYPLWTSAGRAVGGGFHRAATRHHKPTKRRWAAASPSSSSPTLSSSEKERAWPRPFRRARTDVRARLGAAGYYARGYAAAVADIAARAAAVTKAIPADVYSAPRGEFGVSLLKSKNASRIWEEIGFFLGLPVPFRGGLHALRRSPPTITTTHTFCGPIYLLNDNEHF